MKHLILIDDEMLSYFRVDDYGKTIVFKDERDFPRGFSLIPLVRPILVTEQGEKAYLTQKHIDCLLDYEREESIKRVIESFHNDLAYPWPSDKRNTTDKSESEVPE